MAPPVQAFWLPKAGNSIEEYEDAFAAASGSALRCAVADGATETSFAGLWARALVDAYCLAGLEPDTLTEQLPDLQHAWQVAVGAHPLPWYAEEKARQGAFSSLVGLSIIAGEAGGTWTALAIGDSCLFQMRAGALLTAFPLAASGQFTSRPVLVSSNPARNDAVVADLAVAEGQWQRGDRFYLMTDALACWFLDLAERASLPVDLPGGHMAAFAEWIAGLRQEGGLRNDDVTLLRIDLL